MADKLHPLIDKGLPAKKPSFKGGTLVCNCVSNPIRVAIRGQIAHSHACGCTKCWKPKEALFSLVAVVPSENVAVIENRSKLKLVHKKAAIQRHACRACGTHMHGPVEIDHPFQGLTFVHPELFQEAGWTPPGFAAFVSSIIESGYEPSKMKAIRNRLRNVGLEPFDCFSPHLMDQVSVWNAQKARETKA